MYFGRVGTKSVTLPFPQVNKTLGSFNVHVSYINHQIHIVLYIENTYTVKAFSNKREKKTFFACYVYVVANVKSGLE